ncbi:hypothetical protein [Mesorhizobium sp. M1B.F.Ca.ET.045.04.1.1]|uniref:hypothetical protein n=1 Tax=Mesorhizobium sp. M1B.F.Ca.ET.045.04.1.1 TaxID=2493673 RepID=UPI00167B7BE1|nr:hypothetical protein [Mesorhizobium sp. M1B.F.Ca.ET.045.04.1.1]
MFGNKTAVARRLRLGRLHCSLKPQSPGLSEAKIDKLQPRTDLMTYSCCDFTESILEILGIHVPGELSDDPAEQAEAAVHAIRALKHDRARLIELGHEPADGSYEWPPVEEEEEEGANCSQPRPGRALAALIGSSGMTVNQGPPHPFEPGDTIIDQEGEHSVFVDYSETGYFGFLKYTYNGRLVTHKLPIAGLKKAPVSARR